MDHTPTLAPIWSSGAGRLPINVEAAIIGADDRPCAIHLPCLNCGGQMRAMKLCETPREFICENGCAMMLAHIPYGVTIDMAVPGVQHCLAAETIEAIKVEAKANHPTGVFQYVEGIGKGILRRFPDINWAQMIYLVWQCIPEVPSREFGLMMAGVPMMLVAPQGGAR